MERLGEGVRRELARFRPVEGMAELVECWPRAVGGEIARNAWPARLARDGTLHVSTASAAWAFELAHLEGRLLARLTEEVPQAAPKRLRFAVGTLPEPDRGSAPGKPREAVRPTAEELERGRALAAGIENQELRDLVAQAAAASLSGDATDRSVW